MILASLFLLINTSSATAQDQSINSALSADPCAPNGFALYSATAQGSVTSSYGYPCTEAQQQFDQSKQLVETNCGNSGGAMVWDTTTTTLGRPPFTTTNPTNGVYFFQESSPRGDIPDRDKTCNFSQNGTCCFFFSAPAPAPSQSE